MNKKLDFFIIDDDRIFAKMLTKYLETEAGTISYNASGIKAIPEIIAQKPDCLLVDMMMPEMDGLEVIKQLRNEPGLEKMKIIVVSSKSYEFDRNRALAFGADGYITKPVTPDKISGQIRQIIEDKIDLTFWGIRGTLPVPGRETVRYGGNTSCVSLEFSKRIFFIFDAGTGIKVLSDHLLSENRTLTGAKIFISHPHWDHINALPFFVPLYIQGNEIEICGPAHGDITMAELISGQMDGVYFPIKIKDFSANISFRDLKEEKLDIEEITIKTMLLNHPGHCLGYRVEYNDRSICYVTDNELYPKSSPFYNEHYVNQLKGFIEEADAMITDCTYTDKEYDGKVNWGHSSVQQVVDLAAGADVKSLFLFHHDPAHTDNDIDSMLETAQNMLAKRKSATRCIAPKEKERFQI